jgi:hypothetical protein
MDQMVLSETQQRQTRHWMQSTAEQNLLLFHSLLSIMRREGHHRQRNASIAPRNKKRNTTARVTFRSTLNWIQ